jgi:hypothetical protein
VDEDDGAEGAERGSASLLVCERDQSGTSDEQKQEITHQAPSPMDILIASPNQRRRFSLSSSHINSTPSPPCSLPTVLVLLLLYPSIQRWWSTLGRDWYLMRRISWERAEMREGVRLAGAFYEGICGYGGG